MGAERAPKEADGAYPLLTGANDLFLDVTSFKFRIQCGLLGLRSASSAKQLGLASGPRAPAHTRSLAIPLQRLF